MRGLDPGDHRFIPGKTDICVEPGEESQFPEAEEEIEKRWKDFCDEKASSGL